MSLPEGDDLTRWSLLLGHGPKSVETYRKVGIVSVDLTLVLVVYTQPIYLSTYLIFIYFINRSNNGESYVPLYKLNICMSSSLMYIILFRYNTNLIVVD